MILLRTLGSCAVIAPERPSASAVLAQPKRFALLTYLAVAGRGEFVRRDTILALFWPELNQERGRRVLRQTVYKLRQTLGADALTSRGAEELGVDRAVLRCDVVAFEDALSAGHSAEAMQHYRGDFLTGFHVPEASSDLEEWLDAQRRRLRELATGAAWRIALTEEQDGNPAGAAYWARRAVELDPLDENRIRTAMQLLERTGDRAGALRVHAEYARHADEMFGLEPGTELNALADSIRGANGPNGHARVSADLVANPVPETEASTGYVSAAVLPARKRANTTWLWAFPVVGLVALSAGLLRAARRPAEPPVIAVGPIVEMRGNDSTQTSNVAADLLSTSLARLTAVQIIPVMRLNDVQSQLQAAGAPVSSVLEAARRTGARELIRGALRNADKSGLQLDLQVIDVRNGAVVRGYRAQASDLFALIDEATRGIAASYSAAVPRERIADVTTASLAAYRLYDQGLQAFYRADWTAAYPLFRAALAEDTTFAMAAYYAAVTARDTSGFKELLARAYRLAERATDRERLLIRVGGAEIVMSPAADALADTMAYRFPLDPDAQLAAGKAAVRRGDFLAAVRLFRRVIGMDSLSLMRPEGRCLACDAYDQLWWAYLYADSAAAAARTMREFGRLRRGPSAALYMLAMALARAGRTTEAWAAWQTQDSILPGSVNLDLAAAQLAIRDGKFALADERLRRLMRERAPALRHEAAWHLMISLRAQGRLREATALLNILRGTVAEPVLLLESGRAREAAKEFRAQMVRTDQFPGMLARNHSWLLTHVATSRAAARDTAGLLALADSVERIGKQSGFGRDPRLHHYIRGLHWQARGDYARAAESLRASIWSWSDGYTRANYQLASVLLELHRPAEAIHPLQSALRGDLQSSNLYITRTELHELLARSFDALGRTDSAAVHYRYVVDSWRNADPQFLDRRRAAEARLKELNLTP